MYIHRCVAIMETFIVSNLIVTINNLHLHYDFWL